MVLARRIANFVMTAVLVAVVAELGYMIATEEMPAEKRTAMIGGLVFMGAVVFMGLFYRLRRKDLDVSTVANDPSAVLYITPSLADLKVGGAAFFVAAIGCVLILIGSGFDIESNIWAWCGVPAFGGLALVVFVKKRPASLKLSPDGLDFSGFRTGPIAWRDIRGAKLNMMGRLKVIALELRDEGKYLSRRRQSHWDAFERLFTPSTFTFGTPSLGVSPDLILKAIDVRLSAFGREPTSIS